MLQSAGGVQLIGMMCRVSALAIRLDRWALTFHWCDMTNAI
ncbi:Protein of unknown function [Anaplasma phagocytophilum]|uniref:Uncharacterized protein n=1 Tax=Anaplasma phagocytophilum TaxID=948 RepID=A0A098GME2_ANAPH|nr:Protein of unknown function [Anaplasma phagocytophilum]